MNASAPVASGLSFIHIPKNAGTSVKQAIADNRLPIRVTGHPYPAKLSDEEIVVLRDPADRFISAFNYGRKYWPNQVNQRFADVNELAVGAGDPDHPMHALALVELGNRPEHYLQRSGRRGVPHTVAGRIIDFTYAYEPQSSWLFNLPAHLLRFRHLQVDFRALVESFGFSGAFDLPVVNSNGLDRPPLSEAARAFIERTYAADYEFIRMHALDV